MKSILSLWALLFCLFNFCQSMDRRRNKICYQAMTCIHTAREKCGVNGKGTYRRFYDSCDLLEFNCLKGTDYIKTVKENCNRLPPIDNEALANGNYINNEANQNYEQTPNQDKYAPSETKNTGGQNDGGIQGDIILSEQGSIEGEIELDDKVLEGQLPDENNVQDAVQPENKPAIIPTENQDDTAIEGEIAIDDNGSIEGNINIDMDETDQPGAQNKPALTQSGDQDESAIEGKIEIDDEGNIDGDIALGGVGEESPAGDVVQNQEEPGDVVQNQEEPEDVGQNQEEPGIEGTINMDDDNIEGEIEINE